MIELFEQRTTGRYELRLVIRNRSEDPVGWSIAVPADPQQRLAATGWRSDVPERPFSRDSDTPDNEIHLLIDADSAVHVDGGVLLLHLIYADGRMHSEQFRVKTNLPVWDRDIVTLAEPVVKQSIAPIAEDPPRDLPEPKTPEIIEEMAQTAGPVQIIERKKSPVLAVLAATLVIGLGYFVVVNLSGNSTVADVEPEIDRDPEPAPVPPPEDGSSVEVVTPSYETLTDQMRVAACETQRYPENIRPPQPPIACDDTAVSIPNQRGRFSVAPLDNDLTFNKVRDLQIGACDQSNSGSVTVDRDTVLFDLNNVTFPPDTSTLVFRCTIANGSGQTDQGSIFVSAPIVVDVSLARTRSLPDLSEGPGVVYWLPNGEFHRVVSTGDGFDTTGARPFSSAASIAKITPRWTEGTLKPEDVLFNTGLLISFNEDDLPVISQLPRTYDGPLTVGRIMQNGGTFLKKFEGGNFFFTHLKNNWLDDTMDLRWSDDLLTTVQIPMAIFRVQK